MIIGDVCDHDDAYHGAVGSPPSTAALDGGGQRPVRGEEQ